MNDIFMQTLVRCVVCVFFSDATHNITGLTVDQLSVFESLQEITGYLMIQAQHEHFTNLSFLRNLVTIHGRNFGRYCI